MNFAHDPQTAILVKTKTTVLEKVEALEKIRCEWERHHGKISIGRPRRDGASFYADLTNITGVSKKSLTLLQRIARGISPELRAIISKNNLANNQALLLELAGLDPATQRAIVQSKRHDAEAISAQFTSTLGHEEEEFRSFWQTWESLNNNTKRRFLSVVLGAVTPDTVLRDLQPA